MENNNSRNSNRNWLVGLAVVLALLIAGAALAFSLFNQPEPVSVDTEAVAQSAADKVLAALPTPAPTATPVNLDDVKGAAYDGMMQAYEEMEEMARDTPEVTATMTNTVPTSDNLTTGQGEASATPEPTVTATPAPTVVPEATDDISDTLVLTPTYSLELTDYYTAPITFAGGPSIHLSQNGDWFAENTANATWDNIGTTWKTAAEGCTLPAGCNVVGPSGVLGIEDWDEAQQNDSGIWLGSIYHDSPDATDTEFAMLCPEGSFCSSYALNFGSVEIGPAGNPFITLHIPTCGDNCGQGLLIQNWLERPDLDLNTTVVIRDYGEPAAASYTEYAVDPDNAERFSEAYLTDQAVNAHARRNNGSGPEDNDLFIQHIFSLTDMSYTILGHTEADGWFLIWTNVGEYGEH